jgi:hypothetical protein
MLKPRGGQRLGFGAQHLRKAAKSIEKLFCQGFGVSSGVVGKEHDLDKFMV